jgi:hypothetical protein
MDQLRFRDWLVWEKYVQSLTGFSIGFPKLSVALRVRLPVKYVLKRVRLALGST